VELVNETGDALALIVNAVSDISTRVSAIASSAREQSTGLNEINNAVNDLDQVTQQNAAMFEETTAASHALTSEATALVAASERFKLARTAKGRRDDAALRKSTLAATTPLGSSETVPPVRKTANGPDAGDTSQKRKGWQEF
jgi:methyl-accepting chemotaxis protein